VFTVSAKAIYGLCAMLELGQNYSNGPTQIKDIAKSHDIPQHYLEQLLVLLKKTGIVKSFRGTAGGYSLARSPSEIKVSEILTCLDGKVEVVPELKKNNAASFFWNNLQSAIEKIIDISLEDLLLDFQDTKGKFIYTI
jgi:Rrf2 family transcriptional regulator, cysteine metabolism repressor